MNNKEIEFILQEGEGQFIEFKESLDKYFAKEIEFENQTFFVEINTYEKLGEELTENQEKIIHFILRNPTISAVDLSGQIGISSGKIEKNLSTLRQKGMLKRIGPAKGVRWEVIE